MLRRLLRKVYLDRVRDRLAILRELGCAICNTLLPSPRLEKTPFVTGDGRGFYFCSSCNTGYYNADKCPSCGTKTRKEGRKEGE